MLKFLNVMVSWLLEIVIELELLLVFSFLNFFFFVVYMDDFLISFFFGFYGDGFVKGVMWFVVMVLMWSFWGLFFIFFVVLLSYCVSGVRSVFFDVVLFWFWLYVWFMFVIWGWYIINRDVSVDEVYVWCVFFWVWIIFGEVCWYVWLLWNWIMFFL